MAEENFENPSFYESVPIKEESQSVFVHIYIEDGKTLNMHNNHDFNTKRKRKVGRPKVQFDGALKERRTRF